MSAEDDWDEPTDLDGAVIEPSPDDEDETVFREPVTAPHHSGDFLAGRETGFTEGVVASMESLADELRRARVPENEIPAIVSRVRTGALVRG